MFEEKENNTIFFIGISNKPNCAPFDPLTKSGSVISQISCLLYDCIIIKTNLVNYPLFSEAGKMRYPTTYEMDNGWIKLNNKICKISPQLLVTFGYLASTFIHKKLFSSKKKLYFPKDFSYVNHLDKYSSYLLSFHHPSYVSIYRKKEMDYYVNNIVQAIRMSLKQR